MERLLSSMQLYLTRRFAYEKHVQSYQNNDIFEQPRGKNLMLVFDRERAKLWLFFQVYIVFIAVVHLYIIQVTKPTCQL